MTWDEIPGLDQNGIITDYEVQIQPLDFPADISVDLLNTSSLLIVVTGLEEYVFYNISVRAYTSVGPGPYSDPVTQRTLEDRKYVHMFDCRRLLAFSSLIQDQPHLLRMWRLLLYPLLRLW